MILTLGVFAIIIVGIFIIYNKVKDKVLIDLEIKDMNIIVSGIKNLYSSTGNYSTLTTEVAYRANILPDNLHIDPDKITAFDGATSVLGANLNISSDDYLTGGSSIYEDFGMISLNYNGIASEYCLNFVNEAAPLFKRIQLDYKIIKNDVPEAGKYINQSDTSNIVNATTYDISNVAKLCAAQTTHNIYFMTN